MQNIALDDMQWSETSSGPWQNEFHLDLKQTTTRVYMRIPKLKDSVAWNPGVAFYLILAFGQQYKLDIISTVSEYYCLSFDKSIVDKIKSSYNLSSSFYRKVKFKATFSWRFDYSAQAVYEAASVGSLLMRDMTNRSPTIPSNINLPSTVQGGTSCYVSWSAASDPDGNLEGYIVERSYNGGSSWSQVYQGSGLSFTETIPKGAHTSVTYRVRAYDSFGSTSGYATSPTRTISNNTAPVIQCDLSGDLGDKTDGFTIPYTVRDAENQAVTVTEKVGGMVKRTYAVTLGQSNSFQITGAFFQKVLNGKQTAEIIATDSEGKSSTLSLTFTKKVHRASIMLNEPLAVDKPITVCVIKVLGSIPEDAEFKIEVANNAGDTAPAWEDATEDAKLGRNHVFSNKTQTNGWKFGFRVTAERGASDTAGNIVSIQGGFQ